MKIPRSTYRLQLRESFDLTAATKILDYLWALGVDWVYLSPLLQAAEGSEHGYDVVDPSRVDRARGGTAALKALTAYAHGLGMGVLADIVPNHMGVGIPAANRWWWDVLKHGPASRYAQAFDIDWEFGNGRVRLPVVADGPDELALLEIVGEELHYRGQRFPLAPGSAADGADPQTVLSRQHYELIGHRRADCDLNYRRFFAVSSLAALRVEVPWVFQESHAEALRWVREGQVDGLRVDHPDGLADPAGYLDRLAAATAGAYVLVEKILGAGEQLPTWWAASGTTGYDALAEMDRVLVDPAGRPALDRLDAQLRDGAAPQSWEQLQRGAKREVARGILRPEVLRLARDVARERDLSGPSVVDALTELLAAFPVYRSYLPAGAEYLRRAVETVKAERPALSGVLDRLSEILGDRRSPAAIRFQQTSGMVMAKGVEDRAYYRYTRLGSLTEVGGDPGEFSIAPAEFHRRQRNRQAGLPASMTALSTHDTKRGEDVRARISVLAEIPREWSAALARLRELAPLGDGPLECLLWQAILGAWPASRERLHGYAQKAAREAGNSTSWDDPDERFERRMHALVDAAFDDPAVVEVLARLVDRVRLPGWSNSLSAKLLQLTAPGVPDVYQGSELWEDSLADPDNRRAVGFALRARELALLDGGELPELGKDGAVKLLVTSRALRLRRDRPDLFTRYLAVTAFGPAAAHLVAFDRGGAVTLATRLPLGLERSGGWRDTGIHLARRGWIDVLTGRRFPGGKVQLAQALARYPVALLAPESLDPRQPQERDEPP